MTTLHRSHGKSSDLFDLIDKHVKASNPVLLEFYQNADKTRQHLKDIGAWPTSASASRPPRKKKSNETPQSVKASYAYAWGIANNATIKEASERYGVPMDAIHSYVQYRALPKLRGLR